MSRENENRMQTLQDTNSNYFSGENLDPELQQLKVQLAAIQEQQRLQNLMIKKFQQQLKNYQEKHHLTENEGRRIFFQWFSSVFLFSLLKKISDYNQRNVQI